jgi:hypothetical protein
MDPWQAWIERQEKETRGSHESDSGRSTGPIQQRTILRTSGDLAEWRRGPSKQVGIAKGGISPGGPWWLGIISRELTRQRVAPGIEGWRVIDSGTITLTNRHILFEGEEKTLQWDISKLMNVAGDAESGCFILEVANRKTKHLIRVPSFQSFEAELE